MFDVVTFGSSSLDIFFSFSNKKYKIIKEEDFITSKGICFPLGSKIEVDDMSLFSGGGGTNTAFTFSNQGFKTAFCGKVGNDSEGEKIIKELKTRKIETKFVSKDISKSTNTSVILDSKGRDRTILLYRGASDSFSQKNIEWEKINSKWFYIAPLSGKTGHVTEKIISFAYKNKIKMALNPGISQLSLPKSKLKNIIGKIDILILNQEEASFLTKISYQKEIKIFNEIDKMCHGIVIMTKGERGVVVSDGKNLYRAKPLKTRVVDRTGAGDSFGSGFVSEFIKSGKVEKAIQMGIANSSACLGKRGAKMGLLKKNEKIKKVKIIKEACTGTGVCCKCQ